jgi:hypothetical protein
MVVDIIPRSPSEPPELAELHQEEVEVAATTRDELQDKFRSRELELAEVRKQLSQLARELQSRDDELAKSRALVAQIYISGSWRITWPLRFVRQIAEETRRRAVLVAGKLGLGGLFGPPVVSDGRNSELREAPLPLPLDSTKWSNAAPSAVTSTGPATELQVLQRSGLFDEQYYCQAYRDVRIGQLSPLEHYLTVGGFEGRRPNRLFDSAYYLKTYSDVAKAGLNPALHYFQDGAREGRDPSAEFDTSYYLEANPDVATSGIDPLVHFLRYGAAEGRLPLPPETNLQVLQRSGLFDEQFYCEAYPDVRIGQLSPLEHYLSVGGFEGRRPNRLFDSAYYLRTYSDVAKAGVNPALHYFEYGARERRNPSTEFDTSCYLEANPDVATSGMNPLVHFLRFGATEKRLPLRPETRMPEIEMQALRLFVQQELRGLHESIGSLRALFLSEKLSRNEVGYDVVVTPGEINHKHGTGFLVDRLFGNRSNLLSIRAANHYGGDHCFGDDSLLIAHEHRSRPRSIEQTLRNLGDRIPKRIFCVPFLPDDLLTSIALRDVFNAPLCLYLMDDQNVTASTIADSLMSEFLERCDLRLTTHSEMREAYERKYGLKFYLLPAVVPARLISTSISQPEPELIRQRAGALVGSIWGRAWFDRLKIVIGKSGLACHWFGNHQNPAVRISAEELVEAGIRAHGVVSEEVLAHQLRRFPFAIVPTGTLDENDDAAWASGLSLPGRILFALATSNTPIILLGSSKTPAARLIEQFRIGVRCDYTAESFLSAVHRVVDPEYQAEMRANAIRIAPMLSAEGIGEWIDRSLELRRACDDRFEQLMPA